jgi:hypothetical protein
MLSKLDIINGTELDTFSHDFGVKNPIAYKQCEHYSETVSGGQAVQLPRHCGYTERACCYVSRLMATGETERKESS